jgi:hypothetical protein
MGCWLAGRLSLPRRGLDVPDTALDGIVRAGDDG